jgi:hypothetical protein
MGVEWAGAEALVCRTPDSKKYCSEDKATGFEAVVILIFCSGRILLSNQVIASYLRLIHTLPHPILILIGVSFQLF